MVAKLEDLARLPGWPRLLSREQAAAYVGTSTTSFDVAVNAGTWPRPLEFGKRRLWDRHALDRAVDEMFEKDKSPGKDNYGYPPGVDPFKAAFGKREPAPVPQPSPRRRSRGS